jgi:hypothetical protein
MTREEAERFYEERRAKEIEEEKINNALSERESALTLFLSNEAFSADPGVSEQRQLAIAREVRILNEIEGFEGSTQQLLQKAYERALTSSDAFSGLRSQNQQAAKPNVHEQMERVRQAKRASKSISGSPGSGSPVQKASSLRESLENHYFKS